MVDDRLVRDQIPLDEITKIDVMREPKDLALLFSRFRDHTKRRASETRRASVSSKVSENESNDEFYTLGTHKVFQILTIGDGFNSGRIYYVQAADPEQCTELVEVLTSHAASAKRRVKGISKFQETQRIARAIYECTPFQILAALLILAVRKISTPNLPRIG